MKTISQILEHMLEIFEQKEHGITSFDIQFDITDSNQPWFLSIDANGTPVLCHSADFEPQMILHLSKNLLESIYLGETTGLTQMGREKLSDQTPIDFSPGTGVMLTGELMQKALIFAQRFLNPTLPERIKLQKYSASLDHGGCALPMFYQTGFRSA